MSESIKIQIRDISQNQNFLMSFYFIQRCFTDQPLRESLTFTNAPFPLNTRRKLHSHKTPRASSERLMRVQFRSCAHGVISNSGYEMSHFNKNRVSQNISIHSLLKIELLLLERGQVNRRQFILKKQISLKLVSVKGKSGNGNDN